MTYDQFAMAVEKTLKEAVNEETEVSVRSAEKNNGIRRTGILLKTDGVNAAPTIYLEEYYRKYREGSTLEHIADEILRLYRGVCFSRSWGAERIASYEEISGRIIYRLINRAANESALLEQPYVAYHDLAIVFCVLLEITGNGTATMTIKNEHLSLWDVSAEEIYARACENTERLLPSQFMTMRAMIEEMCLHSPTGGRDLMYVMSNRIKSFGAATILYEGSLDMIAEYLQDNFFVLPSSIHEVIIVPEEFGVSHADLSEMVADINRTQVDDEEVLADHAYFYDREEKVLLP